MIFSFVDFLPLIAGSLRHSGISILHERITPLIFVSGTNGITAPLFQWMELAFIVFILIKAADVHSSLQIVFTIKAPWEDNHWVKIDT